jgi:hypothetical protein
VTATAARQDNARRDDVVKQQRRPSVVAVRRLVVARALLGHLLPHCGEHRNRRVNVRDRYIDWSPLSLTLPESKKPGGTRVTVL